jgi:hypothetical protein
MSLMALRSKRQRVEFMVTIGGAADKERLAASGDHVESDPNRTSWIAVDRLARLEYSG